MSVGTATSPSIREFSRQFLTNNPDALIADWRAAVAKEYGGESTRSNETAFYNARVKVRQEAATKQGKPLTEVVRKTRSVEVLPIQYDILGEIEDQLDTWIAKIAMVDGRLKETYDPVLLGLRAARRAVIKAQ